MRSSFHLFFLILYSSLALSLSGMTSFSTISLLLVFIFLFSLLSLLLLLFSLSMTFGLSGFKIKRVHYGKFGLQIIITHLISLKPNTPSTFISLQNRHTHTSLLHHFRFFTPTHTYSFFFSISTTPIPFLAFSSPNPS